jgi:hypothetical protein
MGDPVEIAAPNAFIELAVIALAPWISTIGRSVPGRVRKLRMEPRIVPALFVATNRK